MQTQRVEWMSPCQMKHSLKRFVLIMSEFSKLKNRRSGMIDSWCQWLDTTQPLMNQHILFQPGSGATASTHVPSFAGSESEREAEPANTHDLIRRVGLLSCWEQEEQPRVLSTQRAEHLTLPNIIQSSLSRYNTCVLGR